MPLEAAERLRRTPDTQVSDYHFGLGLWARNEWGLWHGSQLAKWFNERGIHHADDMSAIVVESFRRNLNGDDLNLEGQIKRYEGYWEEEK